MSKPELPPLVYHRCTFFCMECHYERCTVETRDGPRPMCGRCGYFGVWDYADFNYVETQEYGLACYRKALEDAAKLCEPSTQDLLLVAGEMNAQELRTVKAVLKWLAITIRKLTGEQHD